MQKSPFPEQVTTTLVFLSVFFLFYFVNLNSGWTSDDNLHNEIIYLFLLICRWHLSLRTAFVLVTSLCVHSIQDFSA